jgi:hypothetical protein
MAAKKSTTHTKTYNAMRRRGVNKTAATKMAKRAASKKRRAS